MKISLIENGLDSLRKGYSRLTDHERLEINGAPDSEKFSALKDAVLSIQHGIEILFKYVLSSKNELLIYSDISRIKTAFVLRRKGDISELYEAEGVHTITFKESIDRIVEICGLAIDKDFRDRLNKVESWRNKITHSAVLIVNENVGKTLLSLLGDLDGLLGPVIGKKYVGAQGRVELYRAYNMARKVFGELENKIKAQAIEGLIEAFKLAGIVSITAPGVVSVKEMPKAKKIIDCLLGVEGLQFSCETVNGHRFTEFKFLEDASGECCIYSIFSEISYRFSFDAVVIYMPIVLNDFSPHLFLYSKEAEARGDSPMPEKAENYTLQRGWVCDDYGSEVWDGDSYKKFDEDEFSVIKHKQCIRFLSGRMVFCMNFVGLNGILKNNAFIGDYAISPENIVRSFDSVIKEDENSLNSIE